MGRNKKILLIIFIIIVLPVAWFLLSPFWRNIELDEKSPLIKDNLESMTTEQMEDFEKQTEIMKDVIIVKDDPMPSLLPSPTSPTPAETAPAQTATPPPAGGSTPSGPKLIAETDFHPRAHEVEGRALLIDDNGDAILRFENFNTVNGPNLHIYLASSLGDDDFIDLGKIRATKGNVNYEFPAGTDLSKYDKVLVWCVPFGILFSYADFNL